MSINPDRKEETSLGLEKRFSRRKFLHGLAAAALLGAGISACAQPEESATATKIPTETPNSEPSITPALEEEAIPTPVRPDFKAGAGGEYSEEQKQLIEGGAFAEQEKAFDNWINNYWGIAENRPFLPNSAELNFSYKFNLNDPQNALVILEATSRDYPEGSRTFYFPIKDGQFMTTPPEAKEGFTIPDGFGPLRLSGGENNYILVNIDQAWVRVDSNGLIRETLNLESREWESIEKDTVTWDTTELETSKGQNIEFSLAKTENDPGVEEVFAEMNIREVKLNDMKDANGEKLNPNVESQLVKSIEGFFYLTYKYQNNLEDLTFEDFLTNSAQNTILLPVWDKNKQKEVEIDVSLDQVKSFEMRYTSDTQEEARLQLLSKGLWPDNTQQGYDFNPQTGKFTLFCVPKIAPQYEIHLEQGEKNSIQAGFLSNIDFLYGLGYLPQKDFIRSQGGFSKVQNGEQIKPILSLATISSTNPNYIGYEPGNLEDFLVTDLNTGKTTYNQKYPDQISAYKAYLNTVTIFTANSLR